MLCEFARAHPLPAARELQRAIEIGCGRHVAKCRHLRVSVNTSPHQPTRRLSPNCPRTIVGERLLPSPTVVWPGSRTAVIPIFDNGSRRWPGPRSSFESRWGRQSMKDLLAASRTCSSERTARVSCGPVLPRRSRTVPARHQRMCLRVGGDGNRVIRCPTRSMSSREHCPTGSRGGFWSGREQLATVDARHRPRGRQGRIPSPTIQACSSNTSRPTFTIGSVPTHSRASDMEAALRTPMPRISSLS